MISWQYMLAEIKRKRLLSACHNKIVYDYLSHPLAAPKSHFLDTEFLVVDLETTGLDLAQDRVLSMGYTLIKNGRIKLAESGHHYFYHDDPIPDESVAVHQITEQQARQGEAVEDILPILLGNMRARIMVAHFSRIETTFIRELVRRTYHCGLPFLVIDTLKLEHRYRARKSHDVPPTSLRLFNLRKDFNLPRYKAHNALIDAISTAELMLAQVSRMSPSMDVCVGELLT